MSSGGVWHHNNLHLCDAAIKIGQIDDTIATIDYWCLVPIEIRHTDNEVDDIVPMRLTHILLGKP